MSRRYDMLGDLAAGGMGVVSVARLRGAHGFSKLVAVKRIHPHLASKPSFREMLAREARLAGHVRHPAVVQVHELATQDGELLLVMDLVEGSSLRRVLDGLAHQGEGLSPQLAVRIAIDAARGLHALHTAVDDQGNPLSIVHRDVSPQNLLLSFHGETKITDFGIATAMDMESGTTSTVRGKPAYLAPEQLRGERADVASDVWALGVVLWEMLADQRLFKGSNDFDTIRRVQEQPIERLDAIDPERIDATIADVVASALERDPRQRVNDMDDLADALDAAMPSATTIPAAELGRVVRAAVPDDEDRFAALLRGAHSSPSLSPPRPRSALPRRAAIAVVGLALGFAGARLGVRALSVDPPSLPTTAAPPPSEQATILDGTPPPQPPTLPATPEARSTEPTSPSAAPPSVEQTVDEQTVDEETSTAVAPVPPPTREPRVEPPRPERRRDRPPTPEGPPRQEREGPSMAATMESQPRPDDPMTEFPL